MNITEQISALKRLSVQKEDEVVLFATVPEKKKLRKL